MPPALVPPPTPWLRRPRCPSAPPRGSTARPAPAPPRNKLMDRRDAAVRRRGCVRPRQWCGVCVAAAARCAAMMSTLLDCIPDRSAASAATPRAVGAVTADRLEEPNALLCENLGVECGVPVARISSTLNQRSIEQREQAPSVHHSCSWQHSARCPYRVRGPLWAAQTPTVRVVTAPQTARESGGSLPGREDGCGPQGGSVRGRGRGPTSPSSYLLRGVARQGGHRYVSQCTPAGLISP